MFCPQCGTELADDTKVCAKCGTSLADDAQPEPAAPSSDATAVQLAKANFSALMEKIPLSGKQKVAAAAGLVVLLLVILFFATRKPVIDLNQYLTVDYSGYNTFGTASAQFDINAVNKKYKGKIKLNKKAEGVKNGLNILGEFITPETVLSVMLENPGRLSRNSELKNGDKITYNWSVNVAALEETLNCKFKFKDVEYTVEGLQEVKTFDAFAGLKLSFEGIAPNGTAKITKKPTDEMCESFSYKVSPDSGLKNGDKVKVRIQDGEQVGESAAQKYGSIPAAFEQEYTVEGLASYLQKAEQIPADLLEKLKNNATDSLRAYAARDWSSNVKPTTIDYVGNLYLVPKEGVELGYNDAQNMLYLIFRITATISNKDKAADTVSYLWLARYTDLSMLPDNTVSVDTNEMQTIDSTFTARSDGTNYRFYGFQDEETMINKVVTTRIDRYTYEKNTVEAAA